MDLWRKLGEKYNFEGLCYAAADGRLEDVKEHLQNGVDVNGGWYNRTPLHRAAGCGHLEVVQLLISKGAKVDSRGEHGWTALHRAADCGCLEVAQLLISKGAKVNSRGEGSETPLHRAAAGGHLEIVQLLVSEGAKVDSRDMDDQTPLYRAAEHNHLTIVEFLLSIGAQEGIKDRFQRKPADVAASTQIRTVFRNFIKTKKTTIAALQKCITKAKNQKGKISGRFIKILFSGSGAAGKTSFTNLLMKNKFVDFHHSTNIVQAKHAVAVRKAVVVGSSQSDDHNVVWLEMDDDSQISHLRKVLLSLSRLPKTKISNEAKPSLLGQLPQPNDITIAKPSGDPNVHLEETSSKKKYVSYKSLSAGQKITGLFQKPVKCEEMASFSSLVETKTTDYYFHPSGEVLNIITLLDTGGQPEYIHLLPTVNIHPMVNFVIHDLSKSLEDQVLVEYSEHGKAVFEPYHLKYSNFDMIKFLMSSINDSLERTSSQIPQLVTTPGKNNSSYLCCVGTHADKVGPDTIRNTDRQLTAMVKKLDCRAAVWQNKDGGVLFPVDNTTAGNDSTEDPIASFIRNKIDDLSMDKDLYELPITWMLFELEIRQVCSNGAKAYISLEDCYSIARQTNLIPNKEDVRSALIYHHLLGVLLYYPDVPGLCDYVIVDHQWLFDRISSIVCFTFKHSSNMLATNSLKYNGILTKELIQELKWKEEIKEEHFIALLVEMKIIAPIQREDGTGEDYFIPYILPTYTTKSQCNDVLSQYGCLQGEPLLIQFTSNLLPRGFFCCLAVQILQQLPKGWNHLIVQGDTYHTYSNLITFRLQGAYFLSLLDKFSYLEIQIRQQKKCYYKQFPVHLAVQDILAKSLENVCEQLNFNHGRLQYGFHCECGSIDEAHIAVLTKLTPPFDYYAMCRYGSTNNTELKHEHTVWLTQEVEQYYSATGKLPTNRITQSCDAGNWHPKAVKNVYKEFRIKLMTSLPMDDALFLELLRKHDLFPGNLQEQVQAKITKAEKTTWFLDHAIEPALVVDVIKPLHKLLTVMSDDEYVKSDLLKDLAAKIQQQLDKETSLISMYSSCKDDVDLPPDPAGEDRF